MPYYYYDYYYYYDSYSFNALCNFTKNYFFSLCSKFLEKSAKKTINIFNYIFLAYIKKNCETALCINLTKKIESFSSMKMLL